MIRPVGRGRRHGIEVVLALRICWAVLGAPTGKRLAPVMAELVATLRRFGELDIDDDIAVAVIAMSPATMDRRLAADRTGPQLSGRSPIKPGSLLNDAIPIRTWAQWDDAVPGFVEIDLVGHGGGNAVEDHCYTRTVTDIATGWTENRTMPNKARMCVPTPRRARSPRSCRFPILGVDSDNGSEFINHHLLHWCQQRQITYTRSRPGNLNDGAHVEQKNWAVVRTVMRCHRYDTLAELLLLTKIELKPRAKDAPRLNATDPGREALDRAVAHGDEHVVKFTTPPSRSSSAPGNTDALAAAGKCAALIEAHDGWTIRS